MTKEQFFDLLTAELPNFKPAIEDENGRWIVKGFISTNNKIYSISHDTKVISKVVEIMLIPALKRFAERNNLQMETARRQNTYPDLTFIDDEDNYYAVDFKTTYKPRAGERIGMTLGSYWGYFRNRDSLDCISYPYNRYVSHLCLCVIYDQYDIDDEIHTYEYPNLEEIPSAIGNFEFFLQPKWKIACATPGSGNTRNIGAVGSLTSLREGRGAFAPYGERVFDDYWMHYYSKQDAEKEHQVRHYHNLKSYFQYKEQLNNE